MSDRISDRVLGSCQTDQIFIDSACIVVFMYPYVHLCWNRLRFEAMVFGGNWGFLVLCVVLFKMVIFWSILAE